MATSAKNNPITGVIGSGTVGTTNGGSSGYSTGTTNSWSQGGTYGTGATASALSHQMMQEANRYNSEEAEKNRQFQAQQAEINRKWQEEMSNTAYVRAMKDLRNAGLNPILAYTQGGASTGTGAVAQGYGATSAMGTAYTDTYNESRGEGSNESYNSSWEHGETTTNIANQISAITGLVSELVGSWITGEPMEKAKSAAKNLSNAIPKSIKGSNNGYRNGVKWNR